MEEAFGTVKLLLLWPIMAKEEEGAVLLLGPHLVSPSASEPRDWDQALITRALGNFPDKQQLQHVAGEMQEWWKKLHS